MMLRGTTKLIPVKGMLQSGRTEPTTVLRSTVIVSACWLPEINGGIMIFKYASEIFIAASTLGSGGDVAVCIIVSQKINWWV